MNISKFVDKFFSEIYMVLINTICNLTIVCYQFLIQIADLNDEAKENFNKNITSTVHNIQVYDVVT